MKNLLFKRLIQYIILILSLCCINISLAGIYYGNLQIQVDTDESLDHRDGYLIMLSDLYDSDTTKSVDDFISKKDSKNVLEKIYEELLESDTIEYVPIIEPSIYYLGDYTGKDCTIVGGESMRNQDDGIERLTGMNTIQLSETTFMDSSIETSEGRVFSRNEFMIKYSSTIPVILGDSFKDTFEVGDVIDAYYYMKKTTLKVIGFIKKDSALEYGDVAWPLDNYILLPEVSLSDGENDDLCNTIIMMDKCEAYIYSDRIDGFEEQIIQIGKIADKYGFAYDLDSLNAACSFLKSEYSDTAKQTNISNELTENEKCNYIVLLVLGMFLFSIDIYQIIGNYRYKCFPGENITLWCTKAIAKTILLIQVTYLLSYVISLRVLAYIFDSFENVYVLMIHGSIRAGLLVVCIVMGIVICKRAVKYERNDGS